MKFKYYNNEISYEEFCKETFRFSNLKNSYFDLNKYHIAELSERLELRYQYSDFGKPICELEHCQLENYLVGKDEQLSNICKKHNIKMFDQTGFLVDRKSQLQTLQMMKEYILENIDKTKANCIMSNHLSAYDPVAYILYNEKLNICDIHVTKNYYFLVKSTEQGAMDNILSEAVSLVSSYHQENKAGTPSKEAPQKPKNYPQKNGGKPRGKPHKGRSCGTQKKRP